MVKVTSPPIPSCPCPFLPRTPVLTLIIYGTSGLDIINTDNDS